MTSLIADGVALSLAGRPILAGVGFALAGGELVVLAGPNGAGKSTLLRALARLVPPAVGRIRLDGQDIASLPRQAYARSVAYLPQAGQVHWPLGLRALVALGRLPHATAWGREGPADAAAIAAALADTGLAGLTRRRMDELSGGEVGRALLARALAVDGAVLLLDEPVASLDPYHQLRVMELLRARAAAGQIVLAVLHDLSLASRFADRVLLLAGGRLLADGPPAAVLNDGNLANVYRITAARGQREGENYLLPWRQLEGREARPCR